MAGDPMHRHDVAGMVDRARGGDGSFLDEGVKAGAYTKADSPDGAIVIYLMNRYGLQNGDFEGHVIHAVMNNAPDIRVHRLHERLLKFDDSYAERYREAELALQRRKRKAGRATPLPASDTHGQVDGDDEYS